MSDNQDGGATPHNNDDNTVDLRALIESRDPDTLMLEVIKRGRDDAFTESIDKTANQIFELAIACSFDEARVVHMIKQSLMNRYLQGVERGMANAPTGVIVATDATDLKRMMQHWEQWAYLDSLIEHEKIQFVDRQTAITYRDVVGGPGSVFARVLKMFGEIGDREVDKLVLASERTDAIEVTVTVRRLSSGIWSSQ